MCSWDYAQIKVESTAQMGIKSKSQMRQIHSKHQAPLHCLYWSIGPQALESLFSSEYNTGNVAAEVVQA